jgi:CheY-like chemotaxis protein
MSKEN